MATSQTERLLKEISCVALELRTWADADSPLEGIRNALRDWAKRLDAVGACSRCGGAERIRERHAYGQISTRPCPQCLPANEGER